MKTADITIHADTDRLFGRLLADPRRTGHPASGDSADWRADVSEIGARLVRRRSFKHTHWYDHQYLGEGVTPIAVGEWAAMAPGPGKRGNGILVIAGVNGRVELAKASTLITMAEHEAREAVAQARRDAAADREQTLRASLDAFADRAAELGIAVRTCSIHGRGYVDLAAAERLLNLAAKRQAA